MTLPLTAWLPTSSGQTPPVRLPHAQITLSNRQPRLLGRQALKPDLDLEDYQFHAVIDWIELKLHLGRMTQAQHVQKVLRLFLARDSHISPLEPGPGAVFDACHVKLQEPESFALVATIHMALLETFGEATEARVTGMEVSVDATPRQASDTARARLLGAMQRTIWTTRDIWTEKNSRPRSVHPKMTNRPDTECQPETLKLSPGSEVDDTARCRTVPYNHLPPAINGTMYLGARNDAAMIRLMDKVKDRQRPDGTYESLSDDRKRVRIEVALKEPALLRLGVTDIGSLRSLKLAKLQGDYFQFRLPTLKVTHYPSCATGYLGNAQETWRARTYLRSGVTGLLSMDAGTRARRNRMVRNERPVLHAMGRVSLMPPRHGSSFVAYASLNRKVTIALRSLGHREETAWKRREKKARLRGR